MANDTLVIEVSSDNGRKTRKVTFTGITAALHLEAYTLRMRNQGCFVQLADESWDSVLFDKVVQEFFYPSCEHGLSLDLCSGPGHYPDDREF